MFKLMGKKIITILCYKFFCLTGPMTESKKSLNHSAFEPQHEISNNVECATSKGSDQPAHMRSLIKAFASRLNIL